MLLNIIGWVYLIFGALYLIKPDWLQSRLKKKSTKKLKRIFFAIALFMGILLIKATWGMEGLIPKIIMVMGFIAILKALFFLKAKAAENLIQWWIDRPTSFYRICAIGMLAFGAFLVYSK